MFDLNSSYCSSAGASHLQLVYIYCAYSVLSDLSQEVSLVIILDLILMKLTLKSWSSLMKSLLHLLYLVSRMKLLKFIWKVFVFCIKITFLHIIFSQETMTLYNSPGMLVKLPGKMSPFICLLMKKQKYIWGILVSWTAVRGLDYGGSFLYITFHTLMQDAMERWVHLLVFYYFLPFGLC